MELRRRSPDIPELERWLGKLTPAALRAAARRHLAGPPRLIGILRPEAPPR